MKKGIAVEKWRGDFSVIAVRNRRNQAIRNRAEFEQVDPRSPSFIPIVSLDKFVGPCCRVDLPGHSLRRNERNELCFWVK